MASECLSSVLESASEQSSEGYRILALPGLAEYLARVLGTSVVRLTPLKSISGILFNCSLGRAQLVLCVEARDSALLQALCGERSKDIRQFLFEAILTESSFMVSKPCSDLRVLNHDFPVSTVPLGGYEFGGCRVWLVSASAGASVELREAFSLMSDVNAWRTLQVKIPGKLILGTRSWTESQIRSLRTDDLIFTEIKWIRGGENSIVRAKFGLGVALSAKAVFNPESMMVDIGGIDTQLEQESTPNMTVSHIEVSDIQLPVSFELDTARISLSDLGRLAAGECLRLPIEARHAPVRLMFHGQVLGTGRLVQMNGNLAIAIESMGVVRLTEQLNA